jgi:hypothetical protein
MRRNKKRIVAAVAVIGALAAGGAAFTDAIDTTGVPANVASYKQIDVTNAKLADAQYVFNATGDTINSVTLTFVGDVSGNAVQAAFNHGPLTTCANPVLPSAYNGTTTTVSCGIGSQTDLVNSLNILVNNN